MPYKPQLPPNLVEHRPMRKVLLMYGNGLLVHGNMPMYDDLPDVCVHNRTGHEFHLTNLEDRRGELVLPVYMQNLSL